MVVGGPWDRLAGRMSLLLNRFGMRCWVYAAASTMAGCISNRARRTRL